MGNGGQNEQVTDRDFREFITSEVLDAYLRFTREDLFISQKSLVEKAFKEYGWIVVGRWGWSIPLSLAVTVFISLCSASSYGERLNIKSDTLEGILIAALIFFIVLTFVAVGILLKNAGITARRFTDSLDVRNRSGFGSGPTNNWR